MDRTVVVVKRDRRYCCGVQSSGREQLFCRGHGPRGARARSGALGPCRSYLWVSLKRLADKRLHARLFCCRQLPPAGSPGPAALMSSTSGVLQEHADAGRRTDACTCRWPPPPPADAAVLPPADMCSCGSA